METGKWRKFLLNAKTVMGRIFFLDCSFVGWDRGKKLFKIEIIPLSLADDTLICFSRILLFHNLQSWTKSLGQYCNIHIFLSFLSSLLKQCIIFEISLQFSLPPPYTKLKPGNNFGYTRPTLFVGWGEGLDLCELENVPETQGCPKTFVHDFNPRQKSLGQYCNIYIFL